MAKTYDPNETALDRIDALIIDENKSQPVRTHMGMSNIGSSCDYKIALDWRWASDDDFPVKTLRKFQDGHAVEAYLISQFEKVDIGFKAFDDNGKQFRFADLGGHFAGSADGIVHNLPNVEGSAIFEAKATELQYFNKFKDMVEDDPTTALHLWNETYFAQAQMYMHYSGYKTHWIIVASAGAREMIECFTEYQEGAAKYYIARAARLITTVNPTSLDKVSKVPSWFECKYMCNHTDVCHYHKPMKKSCRTCRYSAISLGGVAGSWICTIKSTELTVQEQQEGCEQYKEFAHEPAFLQ